MGWPRKASQRRWYLHRPLKNEKEVRGGGAGWRGQSPWDPRAPGFEKGARVTGARPERGCGCAFCSPEVLSSSGSGSQDLTQSIDIVGCQEKHHFGHCPATPVWFPFHFIYSFPSVQSSPSSGCPGRKKKIRKTFLCVEFLLHVRHRAVHFITSM